MALTLPLGKTLESFLCVSKPTFWPPSLRKCHQLCTLGTALAGLDAFSDGTTVTVKQSGSAVASGLLPMAQLPLTKSRPG